MVNLKLIAFNMRKLTAAADKLKNVSVNSSVWALRLAGIPVGRPIMKNPETLTGLKSFFSAQKRAAARKEATATTKKPTSAPISNKQYIYGQDKKPKTLRTLKQIVNLVAIDAIKELKSRKVTSKDREVKKLLILLTKVLDKLPFASPDSPISVDYIFTGSFNALRQGSGLVELTLSISIPSNLDDFLRQTIELSLEIGKAIIPDKAEAQYYRPKPNTTLFEIRKRYSRNESI